MAPNKMLLLIFTMFSTSLQFDLLESKCESYPGKSLFYKNACYLIIDPDSQRCSELIPSTIEAKRELPDAKLKQHKLLGQEQSTYERGGGEFVSYKEQLCVLSSALHCPLDSKLVGTKCYYLNKAKETHEEALNACEYKGMQMFYPHSDKDIKIVIEFIYAKGVHEIWLPAVRKAKANWDLNDVSSVFDYARWFDTTLLTSNPNLNLYTTLKIGSTGTKPIGYMNVNKQNLKKLLPYICSSEPSTVPIVVATTPTTTTKRVPKCPTNGDIKWFKSEGNNITKNPLCYSVVFNRYPGQETYWTWKESCERLDALSAQILSANDNDAAKSAIQEARKTLSFPNGHMDGLYIGLYDWSLKSNAPAEYRWDTTGFPLKYTNWNSGQPTRVSYPDARFEECTTMLFNSGYTWNDALCAIRHEHYGIICSAESQ